jgi:restriction system protein
MRVTEGPGVVPEPIYIDSTATCSTEGALHGVVYIQAKRWENTVQRPEIQKFVGALSGQNARKGVFITTSSFSAGAIDYATGLQVKVVLIDGETLANYMIDYGVAVAPEASYEIKRVDSDYFDEA